MGKANTIIRGDLLTPTPTPFAEGGKFLRFARGQLLAPCLLPPGLDMGAWRAVASPCRRRGTHSSFGRTLLHFLATLTTGVQKNKICTPENLCLRKHIFLEDICEFESWCAVFLGLYTRREGTSNKK